MAQQDVRTADGQRQKWDRASIYMLLIIMTSLCLVFLVGMWIMVNAKAPGDKGIFAASDIVAVLAPALAAIGTVAAGVFGYSLGSAGQAEAQQTASAAAQEMTAARQEASATAEEAAPLVRSVKRIIKQARDGGATATGKHELSPEDLSTLLETADPLVKRLGPRAQVRE